MSVGPQPGFALIVGSDLNRAVLTDGERHWRFPRPPDSATAPFRDGEAVDAWVARQWPSGLTPEALHLLAGAIAEGAFSGPICRAAKVLPESRSLPLRPDACGAWLLWQVGMNAYLAPANSPALIGALEERIAHRLSISGALRGPHRLIWLSSVRPLPLLPAPAETLMTAGPDGWRAFPVSRLWATEGLTDSAFGLLHRPRRQKTGRGWLVEAQLYPPPGTLSAGQWPSQAGCCGLAANAQIAWKKAANEAAERILIARFPGGGNRFAGSAVHEDARRARRTAEWEAVEREALARFWRAPGRPVWHPVPGRGTKILWTPLPAMAGSAVLVSARNGSVIGSAARAALSSALVAARDEFTAMQSGGARLAAGDAMRLRGVIAQGSVRPGQAMVRRSVPLPRRVVSRSIVVPRPVPLAAIPVMPGQPHELPRWDV